MSNLPVYQVPDENFIKIVKSSKTIRQALISMGLNPKGQAYVVLKKRCEKLGIPPPIRACNEKSKRLKITDAQIVRACQSKTSLRAVLKELELKYKANSNRNWLQVKLIALNINTDHWKGQGHLRGKTHNWTPSIPLENILVKNSTYNSYNLKKRLIKSKLLKYECYICNIYNWQNQPLALQLDHINGDPHDHRINNLRLLCPNCHSQTSNFCGRNIKS